MAEKVLDCPMCGKENHLYLNIEKGVFHCFRCGYSGKAKELESQGVQLPKNTSVLLKPATLSHHITEAISDPPDYWELTFQSHEYLLDRGIHRSVLDLLRKKIYDTARGILFFYPDEDYWQVRHWSAYCPPRWVNPTVAPRTPASGVVYHLRTHYDSSRVVLVEGIGDALRVAPFANVAAVLSTNVHEAQAFHLSETYKTVDLLLDGDVPMSKVLGQKKKLSGFFEHVQIHPPSSYPDPGSTPDHELEEILHEA